MIKNCGEILVKITIDGLEAFFLCFL